MHYDLKPGNVFLDEKMQAVVGDFGISSLVGDSSPRLVARLQDPKQRGLTPGKRFALQSFLTDVSSVFESGSMEEDPNAGHEHD